MLKRVQFFGLVRQHRDKVFNFSLYFLRNREDAEDVTQNVFIKLWERWDEMDRTKALPWLMRVAHHECIDLIRRYKSRMHSGPDSNDGFWGMIGISDPDHPEGRMEKNEERRLLLEAIADLPERTQSMVLMHYFEDMKFEDVARVFGMETNAVKVQVHRARTSMKTLLEKKYPEFCDLDTAGQT
jgi:RNA polymerase sigma-70 factor (ECF subfamily)